MKYFRLSVTDRCDPRCGLGVNLAHEPTTPAKTDLRRSIVSITPAGLRLIEAVAPTSEGIYAEIASRFGASKLEDLHGMLRRLESCLLAMPISSGQDERADDA